MSQATAPILDFEPPDFIPESELVDSDGVPLDSVWQRKQINLTADLVQQVFLERGLPDCFVGGNMFVYYTPEQARAVEKQVRQLWLPEVVKEGLPARTAGKKAFKGPDVFVVMGGVKPRKRKVWASWLENERLPDLVFEFQSKSTADVDAGQKKQLYAQVFKAREYFYCVAPPQSPQGDGGPDDPELGEYRDVLVGLRLTRRGVYAPIEADERGWIWSDVLGLFVGRWDGRYDHEDERWLRLYDAQGRLIPTDAELAHQLKEDAQQAVEERRLREEAEQRAAAAQAELERLRASGETP